MARKPLDRYAVLAVPAPKLRKKIEDRGYSVRALADQLGHRSHSHLYRLMTGTVNTTSIRTADMLERLLGADGELFARTAVRSPDKAAAAVTATAA